MATAEEYARWITANASKRGTPEFAKVAKAYQLARSSAPETTWSGVGSEAGKGLVRGASDVATTVGKGGANAILGPILGPLAGQGIEALSAPSRQQVAATPATDIERGIGTGAEILGGSAVTGGVGTLPKAIATGASMLGGAAGEQMGGETGQAIGTLAGIPANAGANLVSGIKNYVFPSVGHIGAKAAGDKTQAVIKALRESKSGVPGVELTSGQASVPANSAEFAALQKMVSEKAPSAYFGPQGISGQQEAGRLASVQNIGGTPEKLAEAIKARGAASDINYEAAFGEIVKRDKGLRELWKNPYFKEQTGEAYKLLRAKANIEGEKMPILKNLTQFLQYVKEGMDARLQTLSNPQLPAISKSTKDAVLSAKDKLLQWLDEKNPAYEFARTEHAAASAPINQMKVGQDLERALVAPATEAERVGSFGSAVRRAEQTVSKATGKPRIQDLTPEQRGAITAIEGDFKRNADYGELASKGGKSLEDRIEALKIGPTGFFSPMASFARARLNQLLGTGIERGLQKAALVMQNPQAMAKAMQSYHGTPHNLSEEIARRAALASILQQGL